MERSSHDDGAGGAVGIENEAEVACDVIGGEGLRTLKPDLLHHREDRADRRPGRIGRGEDPHGLECDRDAHLVVGSKHRVALGLDATVANDGDDAAAGLDAVHMCREDQRDRNRPGELGNEVAGFRTGLLGGVVETHRAADLDELRGEVRRDRALVGRRTVDADEVEEGQEEPFGVHRHLPVF